MPKRQLTSTDFHDLAKSWISAEEAHAAGLFRVNNDEAREYGFSRNGHVDLSGVLFPYVDPIDGRVRGYRLRRDNPEVEHKNGQLKPRAKYLSPPGQPNFLYFPLATRPEWLHDVSLPVVLVEGEKKDIALHRLAWHDLGDSAERPRFLAIGISGAWSWRGKRSKESTPDGSRVNAYGVIPDFDQIKWHGRTVTLWPDSNFGTIDGVTKAWRELCTELKTRRAVVRFTYCPQRQGVNGPDDAIFHLGPEWAIEQLKRAWTPESATAVQGTFHSASAGDRRPLDRIIDAASKFPESAWVGSFRDYRALVQNCCEAPAPFHHAAFNSVVRSMLASFVSLQYVSAQPLSDFFVLVGRTGFGRKDTAKRFALRLLRDVQGLSGPVAFLPGVGSGEGLLDQLADPEALVQFRSQGKEFGPAVIPGRSVLLGLGELRTLLTKGQQDFVKATLLPLLNESWDGTSPIGLPTRTNAYQLENPFLNVVGGTTFEWLCGFLTEEHVLGGFFNRLVFYPGVDDRDLPNPPPPNRAGWSALAGELRQVVDFWRTRSGSVLGMLDPEAVAVWETWYRTFKFEVRQLAESDAAMLVRLPDHVMRQAAVHAALSCSSEVTIEHLQPALDLGSYWKFAYRSLWNGGAETLNSRLAQTIRRHLVERPLRPVELLRKLGGHRDRTQIDRVLSAMLRLGEVRRDDGNLWLVG
jgi:hypothetical protein